MNPPTQPALGAAPDGLAPEHDPDRCRLALDRPAVLRAAAHRMLVLALVAIGMLGLLAVTDVGQAEAAPAAVPAAVSRITPASRSTATSRSTSPRWLNDSRSSLRPSSPE